MVKYIAEVFHVRQTGTSSIELATADIFVACVNTLWWHFAHLIFCAFNSVSASVQWTHVKKKPENYERFVKIILDLIFLHIFSSTLSTDTTHQSLKILRKYWFSALKFLCVWLGTHFHSCTEFVICQKNKCR